MWFDVIVKIGGLCEMEVSFLVKIVAGLGMKFSAVKVESKKVPKNVIIVVCEGFCPGEGFFLSFKL